MSQVIIGLSGGGFVSNEAYQDYYTCRDATSGQYNSEAIWVGQSLVSGHYGIIRGFLYFDTSGIPDNAIITTAIITAVADRDWVYTNFNIIVRGASSASNPLILGDYHLTHYNGENLGELTTPANYSSFTLNIDGCTYINKGGITQFILLSEEDINNDPPTSYEYVGYNNITLNVTYFEPTTAPTVITIDNACKDRQSTTLTATGNVTVSGGGYTYRGFEYYEKGTSLEYLDSMYAVREIGTLPSTGEFEMTLTGLKPLTWYYIRAFAGNIFGIAYGEWVLCSTTEVPSVPSYGIYESTATPTICFYLSEDDGKTWGQKFGPYTTDRSDIEVTNLLRMGSGKKKIKFTSDVLTGISASVMIKLDIKAR